jgi:DNA invertase Pin-like site-specific DNA recombinase
MAAMAEMERGMISERQKDVHRDRRSSGKTWGIDLGPLPDIEEEVRERIYRDRQLGLSYQLIANALNAENVPTAHGGEKWYPATVRHSYIAYTKTL